MKRTYDGLWAVFSGVGTICWALSSGIAAAHGRMLFASVAAFLCGYSAYCTYVLAKHYLTNFLRDDNS